MLHVLTYSVSGNVLLLMVPSFNCNFEVKSVNKVTTCGKSKYWRPFSPWYGMPNLLDLQQWTAVRLWKVCCIFQDRDLIMLHHLLATQSNSKTENAFKAVKQHVHKFHHIWSEYLAVFNCPNTRWGYRDQSSSVTYWLLHCRTLLPMSVTSPFTFVIHRRHFCIGLPETAPTILLQLPDQALQTHCTSLHLKQCKCAYLVKSFTALLCTQVLLA